ncbi:Uncharacterised protein [Chlamydia trachomatis]|nr:Uncharacterised protein [Chlamydia trachomatis]
MIFSRLISNGLLTRSKISQLISGDGFNRSVFKFCLLSSALRSGHSYVVTVVGSTTNGSFVGTSSIIISYENIIYQVWFDVSESRACVSMEWNVWAKKKNFGQEKERERERKNERRNRME